MKHPFKIRSGMSDSGARIRRAVALLLAAALLLSLIPLYGAARYSYAGMDDYRYGCTTHAVWERTHSVAQTVGEAGRVAVETYADWQGSLLAIFLMALQPGIFSDAAYGLSTAVLLSALVLTVLCFVYTLLYRVFRMDRETAFAAAALACICCVQFVPAPVESYYWFNGGVYYTFFFSLSLLAAALLIRRAEKKTALQCALLPLLALCIGLGNLITGLISCVLLAAYVLWMLLHKRRDILPAVTLFALLLAFALNVFSPGNAVRQGEHAGEGLSAFSAVLAAMGDAAHYAGRWMTSPSPYLLLAMTALLSPALARCAFRFRFPAAVTAASFLLLAVGFTPNEFALGFPGEQRIIDIQYYLFTLLVLMNLVWYAGWCRQNIRLSARTVRIAMSALVVLSLLAAGASALLTRSSASISAARMQRSGKAEAYAASWERRLTVLNADGTDGVTLEKLPSEPPLLCMVDIEADTSAPFYFYNEQLAAYFGRQFVLREP